MSRSLLEAREPLKSHKAAELARRRTALALLNEFVAFYTVIVFLPGVFVFLSPTAYQVFTDSDISAAGIAGNIVPPA